MPSGAVTGQNGVLNARVSSGRAEAQIDHRRADQGEGQQGADRHQLAQDADREQSADRAAKAPVITVPPRRACGPSSSRAPKNGGSRPSRRHGVEDPRLAVEQRQDGRAQARRSTPMFTTGAAKPAAARVASGGADRGRDCSGSRTAPGR